MTGFRAETEAGVKGAFAGVGKIITGALAVGGAAELIKKTVEAATEHQSAFAVLEQTVKNAGAANEVYGQSLESLLEREARLKGFSDEDLASSFVRLVSVTHDTNRAFADLALVEDISRARHLGLAQAALAVSKAEQGSVTSLQRLGIVVPAVTVAVDALKKRHDEAVASGAKFTQSQKEQYAAALASAAAQDKQAKQEAALQLIQQRFGGSAQTFADTAAGQFARLHQDVHQFAVAVGTELLPSLAAGAETLGSWIGSLKESGSVQDAVSSSLQVIGQTYHAVAAVVSALAPAVETAAGAVAHLTSAVGGAPLLAGFAAFKLAGLAVGTASLAVGKFDEVVAKGAVSAEAGAVQVERLTAATGAAGAAAGAAAAETEGEATATGALAAAVESLTAALGASTAATEARAAAGFDLTAVTGGEAAALTAETGVLEANTVAAAANAAATDAAGASAAAGASRLALFGRGLLSLSTGPTAAIIGLAGLAAGIVYLTTQESDLTKATHGLVVELGNLKGAAEAVPSDRLALEEANLAVATARSQLERSKAAKGSLEYQQLTLSLQRAEEGRRQALETLRSDEEKRNSGLKTTLDLLDKVSGASAVRRPSAVGLDVVGPRVQELESGSLSAKKFADAIQNVIEQTQNLDPALKRNLQLLEQFAIQTAHRPTPAEVKVILDNRDAKAGIDEIIARVANLTRADQAAARLQGIAAWAKTVYDGAHVATGGLQIYENASKGLSPATALLQRNAETAETWARRVQASLETFPPSLRHNIELLVDYARRFGEIPNPVETTIILDHARADESLAEFLARLRSGIDAARGAGDATGNAFASGFADALTKAIDTARFGAEAAAGTLSGQFPQQLSGIQAAANAAIRDAAVDRQKIVDGVYAAHKDTLDQLNQQLQDAITQGTQAVKSAVASAQQNLTTIGSTIATSLGQIIDAGPLGQTLAALNAGGTAVDALLAKLGDSTKHFTDRALGTFAGERLQMQQQFTALGTTVGDGFTAGLRKALEDSQLLSEFQAGTDPLSKQIAALTGALNARQSREQRQGLVEALKTARKDLAAKEAALPAGPFTAVQQASVNQFLAPSRDAVRKAQQAIADFDDQATINRLTARRTRENTALTDRVNAEKTALTTREQNEKDFVSRRLADLTASVNLGRISPDALKRQVDSLIAREGGFKAVGKRLGLAFRTEFENAVGGLLQQARDVAAAPGGARGQGFVPQIVKPLQALHDSQKAIERARHAQHAETNKILKEINSKTKAADFTKSTRPTGGNQAAKTANELAGVKP